MKKRWTLNVILCGIVCSLLLFPNIALAVSKKEFVTLLLQDKAKDAVKEYLYFDGTQLWVMIASFAIALGMINLSSSVAKHFVGGGAGNNEVGTKAAAMIGATAATGMKMGSQFKRNVQAWSDAHKQRNKTESKYAHESRPYSRDSEDSNNNNNDIGVENNNNNGGGNNNNNGGGNNNNNGGGNNNNNGGGNNNNNNNHNNNNRDNGGPFNPPTGGNPDEGGPFNVDKVTGKDPT